MTYQENTGPLMANSHPGSYCGQDAYSDMLVTENDIYNKQSELSHKRNKGHSGEPCGNGLQGSADNLRRGVKTWKQR